MLRREIVAQFVPKVREEKSELRTAVGRILKTALEDTLGAMD
jgi:hypothetical protein